MAKQPKPVAVSVGFFILTGVILFVFGVFWLKIISTKPAYTFKVAYASPDHLESGSLVYYRGVEVGRVMGVRLADDNKSTLIELGINNNDLKLDRDVEVKIRLEGITGQRYVDITPPEKAVEGGDYLHDGDLIAGTQNMTWEKIQKKLNDMMESHVLENTIDSTHVAMRNLELASASIHGFVTTAQPQVLASIRNIRDASDKVNKTVHHFEPALNSVASGVQQFNEKTKNMDQALDAINHAATQVDQTMGTINEQLQTTDVVSKVAQTSDKIKTGMEFINRSMGTAPDATNPSAPASDPAIRTTIKPPITGSQPTIRSVGCVAGRLNYILKQRFLLFRLMFGKPGNSYVCPAETGPSGNTNTPSLKK